MRALDRKRWRDLWRMRSQVVAAVLVAAVGVGNLVMSQATLESLRVSRDRYYLQYAFADGFAELRRAPLWVARRLADLPGIAVAEPRVVLGGRAELAGFDRPIRVHAVSLPPADGSAMNRVHLLAGALPGPADRRALVLSDGFAESHGLVPGDELVLVLKGRRQRFRIAGIGSSPEYIAQLPPGEIFPNPERFAVVWMPPETIAAAGDLDGAFNSVLLAFAPGATPRAVLDAVDRELRPWGSVGAIDREDQVSHRYLSEELRQLRTMALLFPAVFLSVAAFVLHLVLSRLVVGQREQIGTLKAFGLGNGEIAAHYAGFGLLAGGLAAALGLGLGAWLGGHLADLYRAFYRLPFLDFRLSPGVVLLAVGVSVGAGLAGVLQPALRAARLAPAEAMRPPTPWRRPPRRRGGAHRLRQAHRLVLRNLGQRPLRSLMTVLGLSLGTAVLLMSRFQNDAIDAMVTQQFELAQRHDVEVGFIEARGPGALHELAALPGVRRVEPVRVVPVELSFRGVRERSSLSGVVPDARLRTLIGRDAAPYPMPASGLVLTDYLAGMLGASPGDRIGIEVLDGRGRSFGLPLAGIVAEPFGVQAWLPIERLHRLLGEGERHTGALLAVDPDAIDSLVPALERRPAVAGLVERRAAIDSFYESMGDTLLTFTLIATAFGMVITGGVAYGSARVSLSERSRDLASLRVLGFTRGEVGYLMLGESALLMAAALPLGFLLGRLLVQLLVTGFESDLVRIPAEVTPATYGFAGVVSLATALATSLLVGRRVGRLDLIGVLKARD